MERDYNKYDYQTIVAKIEKANRLIEDYASFGWKKIEECPHSIYENLIEITFEREHKIANKDDMQFLINMVLIISISIRSCIKPAMPTSRCHT